MANFRNLFMFLFFSQVLIGGLTTSDVDNKLGIIKNIVVNALQRYPGKQLVPMKQFFDTFDPATRNMLGKMITEGFALSLTKDDPDKVLWGIVYELQYKHAAIQAKVMSNFVLDFYNFFLDFYRSNSELKFERDDFLSITDTFKDFELTSGVSMDSLIEYYRSKPNPGIQDLVSLFKEVEVEENNTNFKGLKLIFDVLLKQQFNTDYDEFLKELQSTLDLNEGNEFFIEVMDMVEGKNPVKMTQLLTKLTKKPVVAGTSGAETTSSKSSDLQHALTTAVQSVINPTNDTSYGTILSNFAGLAYAIAGVVNEKYGEEIQGRSSMLYNLTDIVYGFLDIPMTIWNQCPTDYVCRLRGKSSIRWYMAKYGSVALGIPFKYESNDYPKAIEAILESMTEDECDKYNLGECTMTIPNVS